MFRLREFGLGVGLLLSLGLTVCIYWPGLSGIFLVDDTYTLTQLNQFGGVVDWRSFQAFVLGNESGPLGRPLSMLSFLINDQYYPGSVESYRYTNLMIHCLCGLLLFALVCRLLDFLEPKNRERNIIIGLLSVFWWLITPFNVSTTLYVVQRMAQVSTLFSLAGLVFYLYGRRCIEAGSGSKGGWLVFVGLYGMGLLAVLGKEGGALIFLFALALEVTLVSSGAVRSRMFVWALILLPIVAGAGYALAHWEQLLNASYRSFTVYERLLTEARLLWGYMFYALFPALGKMGLVHDDIQISKTLLDPYTTALAIVAHVLAINAAWRLRKRYPLLLLALAWFYLGHSLESSIFPLELYFEHRNYMPSMMLFVCAVSSIWGFSGGSLIVRGLFFGFLVVVGLVCLQRAQLWGQPMWQLEVWANEHPNSKRAQTMQARSLIAQRRYDDAYDKLVEMRRTWPKAIDIDLVLLNQACWGNMPKLIDEEEFLINITAGTYYGSLASIVENSYDLYERKKCQVIDGAFMHRLFLGVRKIRYGNPKFLASAQFMDADIYERERDLQGTMDALDRAFGHQKSSVILYRKAVHLAGAGLLGFALEEIDKAIVIEERSSKIKQINMKYYRAFRVAIIKRMNDAE